MTINKHKHISEIRLGIQIINHNDKTSQGNFKGKA